MFLKAAVIGAARNQLFDISTIMIGASDRTCVPMEEVERASSRSTIVFVLLQLTGLAIPILAAVYFQATKKSLDAKEALLAKREKELDEKESSAKEPDVKKRSLEVEETDELAKDPNALMIKQAELEDKEKELERRWQELEDAKKKAAEAEKSLQQRAKQFDERQSDVAKKMIEFDNQIKEVQEREKNVEEKQKDLEAMQNSLQTREKELQDSKNVLGDREREVEEREQAIEAKQKRVNENLEKRQEDLDEREKQLDIREVSLKEQSETLEELEQKLEAQATSTISELVPEAPAKEDVEAIGEDSKDVQNEVVEDDDEQERIAERKLRKKLIDDELNKIIKETEETELEEPFEPEAIEALKKAAKKVTYLKKFYDVMKDDFIYFPDVTSTISNYDLLEEAEKHYFDEDDEFPPLYSGALRSVALQAIANKGEDEDLDLEYMEPLSMDMDLGEIEEDAKELSDEVTKNESVGTQAETNEVEAPEVSERDMRKKMIEEELNKVIKEAEEVELEEPIEQEAVDALMKGAMKVAYLKKFYDVMKDEVIYFPDVMTTISNYDLLEEAEKHYYDEDDEFPALYSGALRSVVLQAIANRGEDEDLDLEYMEPLSIDVEL